MLRLLQVLAAAQAGKHNDRRESYGDAMIIDPWGTVIARLSDKLVTGIAVAQVDLSMLQAIRLRMPIEQHRRYDIYGPSCPQQVPSKGDEKHSSL
jgi:predicted amidohydrolase